MGHQHPNGQLLSGNNYPGSHGHSWPVSSCFGTCVTIKRLRMFFSRRLSCQEVSMFSHSHDLPSLTYTHEALQEFFSNNTWNQTFSFSDDQLAELSLIMSACLCLGLVCVLRCHKVTHTLSLMHARVSFKDLSPVHKASERNMNKQQLGPTFSWQTRTLSVDFL